MRPRSYFRGRTTSVPATVTGNSVGATMWIVGGVFIDPPFGSITTSMQIFASQILSLTNNSNVFQSDGLKSS